MTDERIDALIRRLDVPPSPDPDFVSASAALLLPNVLAARRQDASRLGRLRRAIALVSRPSGSRPIAVAGLVGLLLIALILLATLAIIFVGSQRRPPPPYGLAANGRIAYVSNGHLFTTDLAGTDRLQITFGTGSESSPTFSRDGTRIAYRQFSANTEVSGPQMSDIVVADADGGQPVVIARAVAGGGAVAWSPDSRFLAYAGALPPGPNRVFVAAADGSGQITDLGSFDADVWGPSWSPDGRRLAFSTDPSLFVVNRDGSDRRIVSHGTYAEVGQRGEAAEWSPDGTSLVFTAGTPGATQVYLVGLDGAPERRISIGATSAGNATWAPDGSRIAYTRGTETGPVVVVITDATGREIRQLPGQYGWYGPVWSPDGTRLIVTDDRPGPANGAGPAIRLILDAVGDSPPIEIPAPGVTPDLLPDWAGTWQRLAP